jgi:TolB-like protein/class 3 adenylate cyclase
MERRLAAILVADVVGYSRLMEADEVGVLGDLQSHRRELIDPTIAEHHGRIVKLIGDGVLVEFASVVDAVACAVQIQRGITQRNAGVAAERGIKLRIGVHLGDVIVEGGDIYGDGVNVAARLEGLAEAGGVCISRQAFDQVETKLGLSYVDLGEQHVKNIGRPVWAYRVLLDSADRQGQRTAAKRQRPGMAFWTATAAVLIMIAGGLAWWQPWTSRVAPVSIERMAFPLPDKPSIAVLPFTNLSGDPEQEYFADGLAEDLITDLSKISGLFVISRNSAFTYKGRTAKVHEIAEDLGVRYVLEGSVRRAGDEVRINAQLTDATTGGHLWADRYDGTMANIFDLQDRITERIVDALAVELTPRETEAVGVSRPGSVEAHDAYLLGLSYYYRRTPEGFAKARAHFERAIELEPGYTAAHAALAKIYAQGLPWGTFSKALDVSYDETVTRAWAALAKAQGEPNADVHVVQSLLALRKHQHKQAIAEAKQALELGPNDVDAMEVLAGALIYGGQPQAGIELAERAMRQNPTLLTRPLLLVGLGEFALGRLDRAVERIERAFELGSEESHFKGILGAAYGLLGRIDEAETAFAAFERTFMTPTDLAKSMTAFPFSDAAVLKRLAEGLELAGAKTWYTRDDGGYLPLTTSNQLSGAEIRSLLSGNKIEGKGFKGRYRWERMESGGGAVTYAGTPIQSGAPRNATGTSRIEGDMLCERLADTAEGLELCSVIFRVPPGNARVRWADYVIVTDSWIWPFKLAE